MQRMITKSQILVAAFCLLSMFTAIVVADAHEVNEETSTELVEFELDELIAERRVRFKRRRRHNQAGIWIGKSIDIGRRNWSLTPKLSRFCLSTERSDFNGLGTFLLI